MKAARAHQEIPSTPGFLYHATNLDRVREIMREGVLLHGPSDYTDQSTWPDGGEEERSYWSPKAGSVWMFAPEEGPSVVLRTRRTQSFKKESGTGDVFIRKIVPPEVLDILLDDGKWLPLVDGEEFLRAF